MNYTFAQYQESADYIRSQIGGFAPKVAMILGSGLGYMGDIVEGRAYSRRQSPTCPMSR